MIDRRVLFIYYRMLVYFDDDAANSCQREVEYLIVEYLILEKTK